MSTEDQASQTDASGNPFLQSFARGLSVIQCFGAGASALTISDVAERVALTRANARRILLTLQSLGYVKAEGRYFRLTPKILTLGYSYLSSLEFFGFAQPIMENLSEQIHESCSIGVLDGSDVVYAMRVATRRILATNFNVGTRVPAYVISMGRVLLGGLSVQEFGVYLEAAELKALTKNTVTAREELRKVVARDALQGYSYVGGELEPGICGIAVPLLDRHGRIIAAMNVSLNTEKGVETRAVKKILPELKSAADKINSSLRFNT